MVSQIITIISKLEISDININQSDLEDEKECSGPKIRKMS